jgi:hypothetical protein
MSAPDPAKLTLETRAKAETESFPALWGNSDGSTITLLLEIAVGTDIHP